MNGEALPPERRPQLHAILPKIRGSLLSWFWGNLLSTSIIGVLATVALYLIGVPGALVLGILSGLLEFVSYIGPILSAFLPALIGFAAAESRAGLFDVGEIGRIDGHATSVHHHRLTRARFQIVSEHAFSEVVRIFMRRVE